MPKITLELGCKSYLIVPRCTRFGSVNTSTLSIRLVMATFLRLRLTTRQPLGPTTSKLKSCIRVTWSRNTYTLLWRSSYKTGKRPRPDRTLTDQDRKFSGPMKTVTAVRSSVHHHLGKSKTGQRPVFAVSTGLFGLSTFALEHTVSQK